MRKDSLQKVGNYVKGAIIASPFVATAASVISGDYNSAAIWSLADLVTLDVVYNSYREEEPFIVRPILKLESLIRRIPYNPKRNKFS